MVETTHFALGSTVGANQIEDGFFQYRDGSNHIWYSMFTEYQIGTVVPDFHMYDAPGHVRPGNGTAPCNESADFGYTTFKLMLNGGNQQAGYNYRMIVDCQDGGGQRDLPQLTAVGWKVGLDMSEFEKGKTGIDEIGYVKNLFGQRASDGGWEGWGSVVCYGFSSTMSSHPNQLTSNSYNITLGGNRC